MPEWSPTPGSPTPPFHIRPYASQDRAAVLTLASRLSRDSAPWLDRDAVRAGIRDWVARAIDGSGPDRAVMVATVEGQCIGFVTVERQPHWTGIVQAYVGELVVAPDHEGRGVGQALMRAVESWARAQGCTTLTLDTNTAITRARRFYARLGFTEDSVALVKHLD